MRGLLIGLGVLVAALAVLYVLVSGIRWISVFDVDPPERCSATTQRYELCYWPPLKERPEEPGWSGGQGGSLGNGW